MNIEELKIKSKEIKYATVKGRAQEEHISIPKLVQLLVLESKAQMVLPRSAQPGI